MGEPVILVCEVCRTTKTVESPRTFEEWGQTPQFKLAIQRNRERAEERRKLKKKSERDAAWRAEMASSKSEESWSLLSAGRFGRDVLICGNPECWVKARETLTPASMLAENGSWRIGDYIERFHPDECLPKKVIRWGGWPPPKEKVEAERRKSIKSNYVYLAGPLLGAGEAASQNIAEAIKDGMRLAEAGYVPFVPHLYFFADMVDPHPLDFWYRLDREWMKKCGALVRRPGSSAGSDLEVTWATELRLPIWHGVEAFLRDKPTTHQHTHFSP